MKTPRLPARALALALVTVFLLAACGDGDEAPTPTESPTVAASPQPAAVPAAPVIPAPTASPTAAAVAATATARPQPTASPTATSGPAGARQITTGTVEVRVTDAPPEGVSAIVLTISELEAHQAGATAGGGWFTLIEDERTFDLVKVQGLEEVLGTAELPIGEYTQVRMTVVKAIVTLDDGSGDEEREATVPSDRL